jgi:ABC-type antimicrobial peptide transport system permease subunit
MLDSLWQDVRHAIRSLLRTPAFTGVAILTLSLATGATTAIFTVIRAVLLRPRSILLAAFAALALVLAAVGVYGVMAYAVAQRARELGIRAALGATPANLVGLVGRQGLGIGVLGLGIGVGISLGVTRFLKAFLYGLEPWDSRVLMGRR